MWLQRYLWEANKIYCVSTYLTLLVPIWYECNHWNNTQTMNMVQVKTILARLVNRPPVKPVNQFASWSKCGIINGSDPHLTVSSFNRSNSIKKKSFRRVKLSMFFYCKHFPSVNGCHWCLCLLLRLHALHFLEDWWAGGYLNVTKFCGYQRLKLLWFLTRTQNLCPQT